METQKLKPFWICAGISAGIGIVLGVITLLVTNNWHSSRSESTDEQISTMVEEVAELSKASEESGTMQAEQVAAVQEQSNYSNDAPFKANLTGSIGGGHVKAFEISYNPTDYPNVEGRDSYNLQSYMELSGSYDPDNGSLELVETYDGNVTGNITGTLTIDRTTGRATYSGDFTNYKGRTYSFTLTGNLE